MKRGEHKSIYWYPGPKRQGRELVRFYVRVRDKFTCQDCGLVRTPEMAKEQGKKLFDVHHLNGMCGKKSRNYDKVEDMPGLITLCHKCHFNRPEHATYVPRLGLCCSKKVINRGFL